MESAVNDLTQLNVSDDLTVWQDRKQAELYFD